MTLSFDDLRRANLSRCARWHPGGVADWSLADWMTASLGEVGEACEAVERALVARGRMQQRLAPSELAVIAGGRLGAVANAIKKLNRVRDGLVGNGDTSPASLCLEVRDNARLAIATLRVIEEAFDVAHPQQLGDAFEVEQPPLILTLDEEAALGQELADSVTYLDLAAIAAAIWLGDAVAVKFNTISERNGFPERL